MKKLPPRSRVPRYLGLSAVISLTACGGGGGGADSQPATSSISVRATAVTARSTDTNSSPEPLANFLAVEGDPFTVAGPQTVRYGIPGRWFYKDMSGTHTCSNADFGFDPIDGVAKTCEIVSWSLAEENEQFHIAGVQTVRYGANSSWVTLQVTGQVSCDNATFGDPIYGVVKSCHTVSMETDPTNGTLLQPTIDPTKVPAAAVGFDTARVSPYTGNNPPAGSDIGAFREYCEFSHMSYADPIQFYGSSSPHMHTFMGNTGVTGTSTAQSIASSGNSTCAGGILNRTAYWFPTVVDTADGAAIAPVGSLIYYKTGYHYVSSSSIVPYPAGLRMVTGNSMSRFNQDGIIAYNCNRPNGSSSTTTVIPRDCPQGSNLTVGMAFPQCWDGVNLDSPDHRSHMAYATIGCPSTHPVALTEISFQINFPVTTSNGTKYWRLSSDNYDKNLPSGYSGHADWFNGWDTTILNTWTANCINASNDCHAFLIGDGRILY